MIETIVVEGIRVEIDYKMDLYWATSKELRGLLVVGKSLRELRKKLPEAIRHLKNVTT